MGSSVYNNLVLKVQSLERKLNQITKGTRDNHDSSVLYSTKKPQYYESIQNLLELAKNIKHELRYSLKYSPENRKTLKMYNEVCILESELYNLVNSIHPFQNIKVKPNVYGSKDFPTVLRAEVPMNVCSDLSEVLPRGYYRHYTSFEPQELKNKITSNRCFENVTEHEDIVRRKNSSESFLSSGSSSTLTIVEKPFYIRKSNSSYRSPPSTVGRRTPERIPVYIRKSKSSYRSPPSSVRIRRRTPERIPVYIRKSKSSYRSPPSSVKTRQRTPERIPIYIKKTRGLSGRKREKRKRHKPITKKSFLNFEVHKSDSNKINVHANDLQTQETEVFLIKKKGKPYRPREKSGKNSSSGRYFITRLKKILSRERNKSPKVRKPSTPESREEKLYVKRNSKNRLGISKYTQNDPGSEGSSPQYREGRLNSDERRRKKPVNNRSKKDTKSRRSHDSKPVAVGRSSNLSNNPVHDENQIFYLQDSNFILFPKNLDSQNIYLSRDRGNGKPYSVEHKASPDRSFINPVKISNHNKKNSISSTDSNYEILNSYQNSNFYLKEKDIPSRTSVPSGFKSSSKYHANNHENLQENVADRSINNKHNSFLKIKKYGEYNSSMTSKYKNNEKSSEKLVLLKVVNDPISLFEGKGSRKLSFRNLNGRGQNISLSGRLNKDNSIHNSPFGVSAVTAPSIYLTTVPQQLLQKNVQNAPSLNDTTQYKVERHDYIVNWGFGKKIKSKTSLNDKNSNHTASSSPLKSSPSGKSMIAKNNNTHTLKKSGSKIFPVKASLKDMNNSHAESKGTIAPLQNTRSLSRGLSLAGHQPTPRKESRTDVSRGVGSNQSLTGKKPKKWLQRSLTKLSMISKKSKKTKAEKDNKSLPREASKNSLLSISKNGSTERQPSSEKISKAKSWTSFKRTMSGVGSLKKSGKNKNTKKQAALKKVKSESKLKKQPSLLKRLFSKSKTHLSNDTQAEISEISNSTGPINTSGYEGDKTSISSPPSVTSNHSLGAINNTSFEGTKLRGYQSGSKMSKNKGSNVNKDKHIPLLASITAKNKKQSLERNPKAFNYSLHYSKVKHNCVEKDLAPSTLRLVQSSCPQSVDRTCSKTLWSMGETVLSECELSEFEKHNKYHEFILKPNKCQGCTVHDKKITKSCKKRGEIEYFKSQPLKNTVCNHDNDQQYYNDPVSYFKSIPKTTSSDHFLSDCSDFCDWKKIANEIKECH